MGSGSHPLPGAQGRRCDAATAGLAGGLPTARPGPVWPPAGPGGWRRAENEVIKRLERSDGRRRRVSSRAKRPHAEDREPGKIENEQSRERVQRTRVEEEKHEMSNKLFVGGLSWNTTDEGLRDAFTRFGDVVEAKVITDRETGRSRGFGFVTLADAGVMQTAIRETDGSQLDGRTIRVNEAQDRQGGGGGGRGGDRGGGGGGGGGYGGRGGDRGGNDRGGRRY